MKKKTGEQVHCKHTQTERRARQSLKTTLHFPLSLRVYFSLDFQDQLQTHTPFFGHTLTFFDQTRYLSDIRIIVEG